jgi:XTP/dITP diphosphohydrolase
MTKQDFPPRELVLGTHNQKKCRELKLLLETLGLRLLSLNDFENPIEVEETGQTFIENARLKAAQQAVHLGHWTIGEDSGLCVPSLDGQPGVFSARYSGPDATDERNNQKLLDELQQCSPRDRRAYYVSTIVLADPAGQIHIEAQGQCWGRILQSPQGSSGFGYDPLFEIPEYHRTFAEMGDAVKSVLSHRARALHRFLKQLSRLS